MVWKQPKIDWLPSDFINVEDYNRIKNNLTTLHEMAAVLYLPFAITDMGADKTVRDYPYADEINALEDNLELICKKTIPSLAGVKKTYYENTATINYIELNRIESCCLKLYDNLQNQAAGRPRLAFVLGKGERF